MRSSDSFPQFFKRALVSLVFGYLCILLITKTNLALVIAGWAMSGFSDSLKNMKTMQPPSATAPPPQQQQGVPVVPTTR